MAVSILHPQAVLGPEMASRRAPLADVPNAVNSPVRNILSGSGKRSRAQVGDLKDALYGQPPTKKQILDAPSHHAENIDPTRRILVPSQARDRHDEPFAKRTSTAPPTAFERKLASVREKKPLTSHEQQQQRQKTGTERTNDDSIESVRQWRKHYRKQFPHFVFYFDTVTDDVRVKAMRQIHSLGAREEKFFSKAVTHVVTTRSIPPEQSAEQKEKILGPMPRLKSRDPVVVSFYAEERAKSLFDNHHLQRQAQPGSGLLGLDCRRTQAHSIDVLSRARTLGIKIWALEKLQRVLSTILETDAGETGVVDPRNLMHGGRHVSKSTHHADLEQLLKNEKANGPADRDMTVATQDMITLRGSFIYIHDMDERTRPIMAREYSKPANREDGKWPQFRLTPAGRCPFIEDAAYKKKMQLKDEEETAQAKAETDRKSQQTSVANRIAPPQSLVGREPSLRRSPRKLLHGCKADVSNHMDPANATSQKRHSSMDTGAPMFGSAQVSLRGLPRMVAGEPVASGMQHSHITSAIRSQAISSAAISSTAPGINRRVGDTKEVSILKRKVLERGPSSYVNEVRAGINQDDSCPPPRAAKRKAQETMGVVHEDDDRHSLRAAAALKKKRSAEKEPKAGYCENCRDKFDDFDEHVLTRKHRKFAMTLDNWTELDGLLNMLKRPHKVV